MRVVIAKQDRTYAEALGLIVQQVLPETEIQTHLRGKEVLATLQAQVADYLLLGLNFPDVDGMDLLLQISERRLARHVLIVAEIRDELVIPTLHTARVDAILDTGTEPLESIREALRMVRDGKVYVSPSLHAYLVERGPELQRIKLTPAELRILRLIGSGQDNQEAGFALGLSESTVQTHRRNIMHKLKVSTSAKLVREAVRLGYVRISYNAAETVN
jgi:DNA-binding NarL/FixJ family response regulator